METRVDQALAHAVDILAKAATQAAVDQALAHAVDVLTEATTQAAVGLLRSRQVCRLCAAEANYETARRLRAKLLNARAALKSVKALIG